MFRRTSPEVDFKQQWEAGFKFIESYLISRCCLDALKNVELRVVQLSLSLLGPKLHKSTWSLQVLLNHLELDEKWLSVHSISGAIREELSQR